MVGDHLWHDSSLLHVRSVIDRLSQNLIHLLVDLMGQSLIAMYINISKSFAQF